MGLGCRVSGLGFRGMGSSVHIGTLAADLHTLSALAKPAGSCGLRGFAPSAGGSRTPRLVRV